MHKKFLVIVLSLGLNIITSNLCSQPIRVHKLLGLMPGISPVNNRPVCKLELDEYQSRKLSIAKKYFSVYNTSLDSLSKALRKNLMNGNSFILHQPNSSAQNAILSLIDEVGGYDKLKQALDKVNDVEQQNFVKNYMISKGYLPVIITFATDEKSINKFIVEANPPNASTFKNYIQIVEQLRNRYLPDIETSLNTLLLNSEKFEAYRQALMGLALEVDSKVAGSLQHPVNGEMADAILLTELAFIDSFKELMEIAEKLELKF